MKSNNVDAQEDTDTDDVQKVSDRPEPPDVESWSSCLCTNITVILMFSSYAGASMASQLTHANMFQINSCRYIIMCVVGLTTTCLFKYSMDISSQHWRTLMLCSVVHLYYGTTYNFTASFMPLGNLDGLHSAFATVTATAYDFCKKKISKASVVSAFVAVIGIICLSQPWKHHPPVEIVGIPCEYLDNLSHPLEMNEPNSSFVDTHMSTNYYTLMSWFHRNKTSIGYFLIFTGSLMSILRGVLLRDLMREYPVPPLLFWCSVVEGIMTIILNLIWSKMFETPFFTLPSSQICSLLTVLFVVFSAFGNIFSYYACKRTFVSTITVANIISSVFLYGSQRTLLKQFHPGHANIVEVVGIVLIIFSVTIVRGAIFCAAKCKQ